MANNNKYIRSHRHLFLLALILRLMDEFEGPADRPALCLRIAPSPPAWCTLRDIRITLTAVCAGLSRPQRRFSGHLLACPGLPGLHFSDVRCTSSPPRLLRRTCSSLWHAQSIVPLFDQSGGGHRAQSQGHHLSEVPAGALVALLTLFWLPVLGWELARKIRSREEEDAYGDLFPDLWGLRPPPS